MKIKPVTCSDRVVVNYNQLMYISIQKQTLQNYYDQIMKIYTCNTRFYEDANIWPINEIPKILVLKYLFIPNYLMTIVAQDEFAWYTVL